MAVLKKKKDQVLTKNELYNYAVEYANLGKMQKELETRKKALAEILKENADKVGKVDDKGSYYVDDFPLIFGKMAKHTIKLNEEKARAFFTQKGFLKDVLSVREYVDESKIEKMLGAEVIKTEDLSAFMDDSVSYSVYVMEKKEEPSTEESNTTAELPEATTAKVMVKKKR